MKGGIRLEEQRMEDATKVVVEGKQDHVQKLRVRLRQKFTNRYKEYQLMSEGLSMTLDEGVRQCSCNLQFVAVADAAVIAYLDTSVWNPRFLH